MSIKTPILIFLYGLCLSGCGQDAPPAAQMSGCEGQSFATLAAPDLPHMFVACGTRTLSEAEELVRQYPVNRVFVGPAPGAMPVNLADLTEKAEVLVCNLSSNRGIIEVPELQPTSLVVTGRSCLPLEGVTKVLALGGRLASDPKGDGEGGGTEEWFGVAMIGGPPP